MSKKLRYLLTELLAFEVDSKRDLEVWYEKSKGVHDLVKREGLELPEIVWHYLSDADIRFKEPGYGEHQIEGVRAYLDTLDESTRSSRDA